MNNNSWENLPETTPLNNESEEEAVFEVTIPAEVLDATVEEREDFSAAVIKQYPHLKRVVGILDSTDQEFVLSELAKQGAKGSEKKEDEVEKTEKEIEMIAFARKAADEILSSFGGTNLYDIPLERIHVVKETEASCVNDFKENSIILNRQKSSVAFAISAFHEIVHSKSYNALQVVHDGDDSKLVKYRAGISVTSRDGKIGYLVNLNEVILYELERRFFDEYIRNNENFSSNEQWSETAPAKGGASDKYVGSDYNKYLKERLEDYSEILFDETRKMPEGVEFENRHDIINLMIRSSVSGDILKFGRILSKSSGKVK